jgi:hypothetical protein
MKALLRDVNLADPGQPLRGFREAHALLAFLLLLQELAFARHVAAVAFRRHLL